MIKVAIVEDDDMYIRQLREYLNLYSSEYCNDIVFDVFTDGAMLVERYDKTYNIIFMDIDMPILDGMEAAEEIRKIDDEVIIMFITNMAQYAIRGYAVGAFDYVLKPISYFAFSQCLSKAIARMRKMAAQYITVRINRGIQKLNVSDIKYIESRKHMLVYHTFAGEIVTAGTMKSAEADLKSMNFARSHNEYLINLAHVSAICDGCAIVNGKQVPLSRSRKASFEALFVSYINEVTK